MANRFRGFGRRIFSLFDSHPTIMNSIVGGTVYASSEAVVQYRNAPKDEVKFEDRVDKIAIAEIGSLGALENGILMTAWYSGLAKIFGPGVGTNIVLKKCLADQLFFATQQDGFFLALCAYHHAEKLPQAIEEVKRTFLTTWIADCSLWPVVNFFGFSFVPVSLQPLYMASVQFFWQLYISSMAASGKQDEDDYVFIREVFDVLDSDHNGSINVFEIEKELRRHGLKYNDSDLKNTMRALDVNGDDEISFGEFASAIKSGALNNTILGKALSDDLVKGAKAAIKRLDNINNNFGVLQRSAAEEAKDKKDREDALKSASLGASVLLSLSLIRKFIMKI